jgi:hypothetical protein
MNEIRRPQPDDPAALERVAVFARDQLTQAINELLARFIDAKPRTQSWNAGASVSRKRFDFQYKRFCNIAEALMQWHSNDLFLARDGSPRPLPRVGKLSLTSLARNVAHSAAEQKILVSDLVACALAEQEAGTYVPTQRSAVLGKANALSLAYAAITVTRLLRTISHNVMTGSPPLYERQVSEITISAADLPVYLRFVEQQAQYLVDSVDDWLARRRVAGTARKRGIRVGLGAFAWAEFAASSSAKRRPRARPGTHSPR